MFAVDVKFGAKIAKKMITAKSAMKVLSFIRVRRTEPFALACAEVDDVAAVMTRVSLDVRVPWPKPR
jgi:hypothetical protein